MNSGLAIVGLTLLLVAAVSRRLSGTPVTPAMVVTAIGVLVGPLVLDDLAVRPTSATVRTLAEATLAVVLFSDSSRVDLRALRREASMPVRLLGVGLPLTVVLGGLVAAAIYYTAFIGLILTQLQGIAQVGLLEVTGRRPVAASVRGGASASGFKRIRNGTLRTMPSTIADIR